MKTQEIYRKSAAGQAEIEAREQDISPIDRRVLILVNGEKDIATLEKLSLCDDTASVLEDLLERGLIEKVEVEEQQDKEAVSQPGDEEEIGAREFMCNTLLTFGNRVCVSKLIDEINAAEDSAALKDLVDPWYRAIADTPGGMYEADKLKGMLLKLIDAE